MAIQEVVRLVVDTTYNAAVRCQSALTFATEAVGPGIDAHDIAADFAAQLAAIEWRTNVVTWMQFNTIFAQSLYPFGSDVATVGLGFAGTRSVGVFGAMPVVCAGIVTWRTAFAGRRNRGRTYFAGLAYDPRFQPNDGVNLGTDTRGSLNTIAAAIKTRYIDGAGLHNGWKLVLRSTSRTGLNPPIDLAGIVPVVDYSIPNYIATMGSRRGGRGI